MTTKEYDVAVFIGRFQPPHNEHLNVIHKAASVAEKVIFVIGSNRCAPNIKNPFTFVEREQMIRSCFPMSRQDRFVFVSARDYPYNDVFWAAEVRSRVSDHLNYGDKIALIGNDKDDSSYYLSLFPEWEYVRGGISSPMDATSVRTSLFSHWDTWEKDVPSSVADWLRQYFIPTEKYQLLCEEYAHIQAYKKSWGSAPFAPTFVTADAVVTCLGHVLLVTRKSVPGKGLYALPGGFVREKETIKDAMFRELKEETGLDLVRHQAVYSQPLSPSLRASSVFDYPTRSARGRTITHAFHHHLSCNSLPAVRAADDAAKAFWLPIMDIAHNEDKFFEDHIHIITTFVGVGK